MTCGHCVAAVRAALATVPGAGDVAVDLNAGVVRASGTPDEGCEAVRILTNRFVTEANADPRALHGPGTQTQSSPLSGVGTKRWIQSSRGRLVARCPHVSARQVKTLPMAECPAGDLRESGRLEGCRVSAIVGHALLNARRAPDKCPESQAVDGANPAMSRRAERERVDVASPFRSDG